ncbi:MAG: integron integrase [Parahaliea sp.]
MGRSPFLKSIEDYMRVHRYSRRTIDSYLYWIKSFIIYNKKRHPAELDDEHIMQFLTFLATERNVAAGTQSLALNAIVFLKTKFLGQAVGDLSGFRHASRQRKLPVVLTRKEVSALLERLHGHHYLMAALLYGSGLRRIELVRLRVKDIDFDYQQVRVINGKGGKHRMVTLAQELVTALREQICLVEVLLARDKAVPSYAGVWLPDALTRKYPNAPFELGWHYLFPASRTGIDPTSGCLRRHHFDESNLNKLIRKAAKEAGIRKAVSCHTLRHSFATHLLQAGVDIRTLQQQLGHADVKTTEIYTHVLKQGAQGVKSPLSLL